MAVIVVRGVAKSFIIPSVRRMTVREHLLGLFERRRFARLPVLSDVSFEVRRGETLGIMGRNGSGKSTLLKIIAGIYRPDAGEVSLYAPITPILELGLGWNPELDAIDNILLMGSVMGLSLAELREATGEILAFAELERFAKLKLQHYSSGMAARLAYAVAFRAVRDVLILDEIFAVGDAAFRARCEERYRELANEGHTILLVSHDASLIVRHCDRALLLEQGRVAAEGSPQEVAAEYERLLLPRAGDGPAGSVTGSAEALDGAMNLGARKEKRLGGPSVSIIIPCFNLGRYLEEAVASVFAQTFQDFEILIVNDGSSDDETNALLAAYDRPKTRVLQSAHRGVSAARNLGLRHARGEYICALDADDLLEPTFLARTVALLDADPALTFVSTWLRTFGDEEWVWRQERCDLEALLAEDTVLTAALVRRGAVLAAGGYDEAMPEQGYEDWDLWLSLVEAGHRGTILPEPLYLYRRRAGSLSTAHQRPEVLEALSRYLFAKHAASYRQALHPVLAAKEGEIADLLRRNDQTERRIAALLLPQVEALREEIARLRRRLQPEAAGAPAAGPRADRESAAGAAAMAAALDQARCEVAALRASLSWRVTAPLREVFGWLLRRGVRRA